MAKWGQFVPELGGQFKRIFQPTEEEKFLFLYENLHKVAELHRKENYFKNEINNYNKILNSNEDLKKWVLKNERIAVDEYGLFEFHYLLLKIL